MFTRRTATVTISAPDASCACAITALEGYLPVPTMSRDRNVRPAMTKLESTMVKFTNVRIYEWMDCRGSVAPQFVHSSIRQLRRSSPSADEVHNLHPVAVSDDDLGEALPLQDGEIVLHGHASRIDIQPDQQVGNADWMVELERFAVQGNVHQGIVNHEWS